MYFLFWLGVTVYYGIGYVLAVRNVPRSLKLAREEWSVPANVKGSVRYNFYTMVLFWWIRWPFAIFKDHVDKVVLSKDPKELERRLREQKNRIADLERELGIK